MSTTANYNPIQANPAAPNPRQDRAEPAPKASSVPELADFLRCSTQHLRNEIAAGRLKARKLGRRLVVLPDDRQAYLDGLPLAGKVAQ